MTVHLRMRRALISVVVLASLVVVGQWGVAPVSRAQGPSDGSATLQMIQETMIPPRDRIDLAQRLWGVTDIPAPPTSAPEREIGDVVTFWVDNLDQDYVFEVPAQLVYKNEYVYMFVETAALNEVSQEGLKHSADVFRDVIRPRVHEIFGSEWSPGIDGDPHVVVLHAHNMGSWVAAYYGSSSQFSTAVVPTSNEMEMFFVNLDTMGWAVGTPYYESVLAHEFQHMVQWVVDGNEDTWLNEGLSELASMMTGYGASGFGYEFLQTPEIQLNAWPEDGNRGIYYGSAFMFTAYFFDRYGEAATTMLVRDAENGMTSVDNALVAIDARDPASGAPVTAVDLFADWVVTNMLMDSSVGDGRYAYHFDAMQDFTPLQVQRNLTPAMGTQAYDAPQWGGFYLRVPGGATPQALTLTFDGADTVSLVPAEAHSGAFSWWSNRGDESDMRLTRAFDLSGVDSATLKFWTWYYIEDLWDYAYVMVSTDAGATWTPLRTPHTTDEDPHGNAYGPAYSGLSNGWIQESIDLTPYVGGEVLVRFEYITDDAVNQPGMLVDDIEIPEIGYAEDFENGIDGWESEGWLLTDNMVPQRFVVQVVQPTQADQPVTHLLGEGDLPHGSWEIMVGGEYGDAVITVSGLAPVTTEPAQFTIGVAESGGGTAGQAG